MCRPCKRVYDREYWAATKELRNERKRINQPKVRERNREYIWSYLASHPCLDCGQSFHPAAMDFDHRENKKFEVGRGVINNYSLAKIKTEIEKCDVRCANCHRIKTAKDFNWYAMAEEWSPTI